MGVWNDGELSWQFGNDLEAETLDPRCNKGRGREAKWRPSLRTFIGGAIGALGAPSLLSGFQTRGHFLRRLALRLFGSSPCYTIPS